MARKDWSKINNGVEAPFGSWERKDGEDSICFYPSDEELINQSGGKRYAKYFIAYAQETRMKTFGNKKEAIKFLNGYMRKY